MNIHEPKPLEILVVNDDLGMQFEIHQRHLHRRLVHFDFAKDLAHAKIPYPTAYDGIICDVFLPTSLENTDPGKHRKIVKNLCRTLGLKYYGESRDTINKWYSSEEKAPAGIALARRRGNIPLVLYCSPGHKMINPINKWCKDKEVRLVGESSTRSETTAPAKPWEDAYLTLIHMIAMEEIIKYFSPIYDATLFHAYHAIFVHPYVDDVERCGNLTYKYDVFIK